MRAINLLPPNERPSHSLSVSPARLGAIAAVVVVAGLGWMGWSARSDAKSVTESIEAERTAQSQLQIQLGPLRLGAQRQADVKRVEEEVALLAAGRTDWERLVRRVATVLPKQVWLTALRGEAAPLAASTAPAAPETPGQAVQAPTGGLHIEGMALTHQQVAMTLARIASIPGVGEPRLTSSERDNQVSGRTLIRFVIDASVDVRSLAALSEQLTAPPTPGGTGQ